MARGFGFRRFGRRTRVPRSPVSMVSAVQARKAARCAACKGRIEVGEPVVRLRLRKSLRGGCVTCGHSLTGMKRYHPPCVPADHEAAMGFDASKHAARAEAPGGAVPPPPKPPTVEESALSALASLEAALVAKLRNDPKAWVTVEGKRVLTPAWEKAFKTYQGCKARVLRPSTPGEGEVATNVAIQRIVKMVFEQKEN